MSYIQDSHAVKTRLFPFPTVGSPLFVATMLTFVNHNPLCIRQLLPPCAPPAAHCVVRTGYIRPLSHRVTPGEGFHTTRTACSLDSGASNINTVHREKSATAPVVPCNGGGSAASELTVEVIEPSSTDQLLESLQNMPLPPSDVVIDNMVRHLGDSRGLARLGLVDMFGRIGSPAVPSLLAYLQHSPNPVIRRSCGKALAKIGDSAATPILLDTLVHDEDTVTRSSAAGALAKMGAAALLPLLDLLADPNVGMTPKGHAAWALAFMQDDKEVATMLLEQLRNDNVDVRIAVVNALGTVALGDALPSMAGNSVDDWDDDDDDDNPQLSDSSLHDDDAEESEVSADVKSKAVKAISVMLGDNDPQVRAEAATALANASCIEAAPKIAKMLNDSDFEARRCAAMSLMKLGDTSFINALERACEAEGEVEQVKSVARLAANTLRRRLTEDEN